MVTKSPSSKKSRPTPVLDDDVVDSTSLDLQPQSAPASKTGSKPLRMKVPKSKERALIREFGLDVTALTEEEAEKRRSELKALVKMGKTRGFLTQQEIHDHLPEKLVDAEVIEATVKMLNDMGIAVYEQAPDAATLLVAGGAGRCRDRGRSRGGGRSRAVDCRLGVRPHHRPGAHVHARRWVRSTCSPAKARSRSPSASKPACRR